MTKPLRPNLSLPMVLEAASRVLERDGYDGLTMRAVARELGVQAPAIYWHVQDKQALELALYDHLMSDLAFAPEGVDWREDVRRMAQDLRRHFLSHRDVARLLPTGFFFAPRSMALLDAALGMLLGAGLAPRDASYAAVTTFTFVVNWSLGEARMRRRPDGARPGLDAEAKALIASEAFPNFTLALASFAEPANLDEQFLFGLDALIAGFERLTPSA